MKANSYSPHPMRRREAIKLMTAAVAVAVFADGLGSLAHAAEAAMAPGYGMDPDLLKKYKPGELWPLTLSPDQRRTATTLADVIIPADESSPSASQVGVIDFIDDWVSAPYPSQRSDRRAILSGLAWLEEESNRRFGKGSSGLDRSQQEAICDDICYLPNAKDPFVAGARFFKRFRDLAAGGYYTTPAGMKAIGYVGNVPTLNFAGPPAEVVAKLGLT